MFIKILSLSKNQDEEIKPLLEKALRISESHFQQSSDIFHTEGIPLPDVFTDQDINYSAPPLFYDMFGLSFVYSMSRLGMINTSFVTLNVARKDDYQKFIAEILVYAGKGFNLMVNRGWLQQPPMAPNRKELENMK